MTIVPDEEPAVLQRLRECLHELATDETALKEAVVRCAAEARDTLPPEVLIRVVREELPGIAKVHGFDYWRTKTHVIDWLLTVYYGPNEMGEKSEP